MTDDASAEAAAAPAAAAPSEPPAYTALPPVAADRPEVAVGAAFAGGLVLALFLKRLAR